MTNAADRAVMFYATDKVAAGIASGVMNFLKAAYGEPRKTRIYGTGIVDGDIVPKATPAPTPRPGSAPRIMSGNWQVLLMGRPTINIYSAPGSGPIIAKLPKGQFYQSLLRNGDYYHITLPDGKDGWVHRNAVIVQM